MKPVVQIAIGVSLIIGLNACESTSDNGLSSEYISSRLASQDTIHQADPWIDLTYAEREGKQLYDHYCAVCHGVSGEGDGFNAFNLDPRPRNLTDSAYIAALSDATLGQIITYGGRGMNRSVLMPAYQNTMTEDQVSYLIAYIRTFGRRTPVSQ
jgi:mono/diheme cytochrome c family protein